MWRISATRNKKRALCWALVPVLLFSGCSGQTLHSALREIDQIELVETLGADDVAGMVRMSVSTNVEQSSSAPTVLAHSGSSVAEALEKMSAFTPKRYLFFGHTKHFVLGQAAAEKGLGPYMDYVERAMVMRLDTNLFIVKDGSAEEVITGEGDISSMLDSLENDIRENSEGYVYNFKDVAQALIYGNTALVAAVEAVPAEEYQPGVEGDMVRFAGYALIRDGKLVAFADPDCAKGINLLIDQVEGGILPVPDGKGGYASLRLTQSKLELEPQMEQGKMTSLTLKVDLKMNLEGLQNSLDVYDPQVLQGLEEKAAQIEKMRLDRALDLAQSLDADFYGLGKRLELEKNSAYRSLDADWKEVFPGLPLKVQVEVEVERSYDIGNFVQAGPGQ